MKIDWSSHSPGEIWQALMSPPRIAGPWRAVTVTWSPETKNYSRRDQLGNELARTTGRGERPTVYWCVTLLPYAPHTADSGAGDTLRQAQAAADEVLQRAGFLLVEHGRAGLEGHRPLCLCGLSGSRSEKYDSYYCPDARIWLEPAPEEGSGFEGRPETAEQE